MFADERRAAIMNMLQSNGSVTVVQLIEAFNVSIETIRRDLAQLESSHQLSRVHGGAILPQSSHKVQFLRERLTENLEKKRKLCRTALQTIEPGDSIFIDSGATAIELATYIRDSFTNLTVVTNSTDVFDILRANKSIQLIVTGGLYMPEECLYHGSLVIDALKSIHVNKAYLIPTTLDLNNGFFADFEPILTIQRTVMHSADKIYLLADSSKIGHKSLFLVASLDDVHSVITDDELDPRIASSFHEAGIPLIQ